ncbi:DNA cross-link repair 1A protein, partial [Gonapodya sp. JEL0774]
HVFPSQEHTTDTLARIVKDRLLEDSKIGERSLFLIATYTIGKERALRAIHSATGLRACVSTRKLRILRLLELPYLTEDLLTTDPRSTSLHVVPWGLIGAMAPGGWKFCPDWGYLAKVLESENQNTSSNDTETLLSDIYEDRMETGGSELEDINKNPQKDVQTGPFSGGASKRSAPLDSLSAEDEGQLPAKRSRHSSPTCDLMMSEPLSAVELPKEGCWSTTSSSFTRLLALVPTGWTHDAAKHFSPERPFHADHKYRAPSDGGSVSLPHLSVFQVPYSEHSSFSELCAFMDFVRPDSLVPTVFSESKGETLTERERRERGMDKVRKQFSKYLGAPSRDVIAPIVPGDGKGHLEVEANALKEPPVSSPPHNHHKQTEQSCTLTKLTESESGFADSDIIDSPASAEPDGDLATTQHTNLSFAVIASESAEKMTVTLEDVVDLTVDSDDDDVLLVSRTDMEDKACAVGISSRMKGQYSDSIRKAGLSVRSPSKMRPVGRASGNPSVGRQSTLSEWWSKGNPR